MNEDVESYGRSSRQQEGLRETVSIFHTGARLLLISRASAPCRSADSKSCNRMQDYGNSCKQKYEQAVTDAKTSVVSHSAKGLHIVLMLS